MDKDLFGQAGDAGPEAEEQMPSKDQPGSAPAQESGASAFEASFARLEEIVAEMERGELPLEELRGRFEEGVGLVRNCQKFLEQAQLRVSQYVENRDGQWVLKDPDQH
ncbi:MAG: exodeoxyribonuclease VII small subunit [bacterium]